MSDIRSFFGVKKNDTEEIVFKKKKGKTKQEERLLEMEHLKPAPIQAYTEKAPIGNVATQRSVLLVFRSDAELDQFKKYFHVANYVMPSVTNIEVLVALLNELDTGRIKYAKEKNRIIYKGKQRNCS